MEIQTVTLEIPPESNLILGHSHFIKTVEDLFEAMVNSVPNVKFGVAFCEASMERLIRWDGTDDELVQVAIRNAQAVGAGHMFIIVMRDAYPINVLPKIRDCHEVVRIFCATANPVQVLVAQTEQGRGILGVVDGQSPLAPELGEHQQVRREFLRKIGYKR
ncbi:MAG: adenosine-specific kinase [Acidobacteria bacterium]|nr:adenosine-specific kinase [Acidobacteriota bacterium]